MVIDCWFRHAPGGGLKRSLKRHLHCALGWPNRFHFHNSAITGRTSHLPSTGDDSKLAVGFKAYVRFTQMSTALSLTHHGSFTLSAFETCSHWVGQDLNALPQLNWCCELQITHASLTNLFNRVPAWSSKRFAILKRFNAGRYQMTQRSLDENLGDAVDPDQLSPHVSPPNGRKIRYRSTHWKRCQSAKSTTPEY